PLAAAPSAPFEGKFGGLHRRFARPVKGNPSIFSLVGGASPPASSKVGMLLPQTWSGQRSVCDLQPLYPSLVGVSTNVESRHVYGASHEQPDDCPSDRLHQISSVSTAVSARLTRATRPMRAALSWLSSGFWTATAGGPRIISAASSPF